MGFFDTVKQKAGELAGDAERAGKVTAAQARLVVLQNDVRRAERDLGHAAFALMDRGGPAHPDLADVLARLRAALAEVHEKEAEIAKLRGPQPPAAETPSSGTPAPAAVVVETAAAAPATKPDIEEAPEEEAAGESPAADEGIAGAQAAVAAKKPAAAKKAAGAKAAGKEPAAAKAPAKKAAATRKPPAKKPAAARKPAAKKPAAKKPPPASKPADDA